MPPSLILLRAQHRCDAAGFFVLQPVVTGIKCGIWIAVTETVYVVLPIIYKFHMRDIKGNKIKVWYNS